MKYGGSVYIMANNWHTVLYIGVTSNLISRVTEHKEKFYPDSFTAKYNCNKLVYYENFGRIEEAISREKVLKKWKRAWKEKLIAEINPEWKDLFDILE
jgi:putative endonuclease